MALSICALSIAQAPRYRATLITDQGVLRGLNNLGDVSISRYDSTPGSGIWNGGTWTPSPANGPINDRGEIFTQWGSQHGIYSLATGQFRVLTGPIGFYYINLSHLDINNNGWITGDYDYLGYQSGGFSWSGDLRNPISGDFNNWRASNGILNNRNEIAFIVGPQGHSVITRANGSREMVRAGGNTGVTVADLADTGEILAYDYVARTTYLLASDFTILANPGRLSDRSRTNHTRMNSARQMTGYASDDNFGDQSYLATYWSATTGTVRLDSLVENLPAGTRLSIGGPINERGQIVALELYNFGPAGAMGRRYYFLDPVPEPASIVALAAGMLALLRRRRCQGVLR